MFLGYCMLSFFGIIKGIPTDESLIRYDVVFYKSIVDNGYTYTPGQQSSVAFFPLFPFLWRAIQVSPLVISIINMVLMIIGMHILNKVLKLKKTELLILLSTPSMMFCYIPYSEAMFFLCCTIFLYGLDRNFKIALLGIFLAGLCRSASMTFIPVLVFCALFYIIPSKKDLTKKHLLQFLALSVVALLSLVVAQFIQYLETGAFFVIFEAQKQWDRTFKFPTFYLTTWDGIRLIWLDGLAFLVGAISAVTAIVLLIRKYKTQTKSFSPIYTFSIGYLAMVTLTILFFSQVDTHQNGTSIFSLNRFVFATPFFFVFLILSFKYFKLNQKLLLYFSITSIIVWILFHALGNIEGLSVYDLPYLKTKIYFLIVSLYSLVYVVMLNKNYRTQLWSALYVFNVILQLYLYNSFFHNGWVG